MQLYKVKNEKLKVKNSGAVKRQAVLYLILSSFFTLHSSFAQVVPYSDGVRLASEERYAEALAAFETALTIEPNHDPSLYGAARVLAQSSDVSDLKKALAYSLRAVGLDAGNSSYAELRRNLLSLVDVRLGRAWRDKDIDTGLELVALKRLQPETEPVEGAMMEMSVLQLGGRLREARKVAEGALRLAATDSLKSELHGAIGSVWHEQGDDRRTFDHYDIALKYNPSNVLVLNNYAYYLAVTGRELDRALGMAVRATKHEPNNPTYLDTHAWVLYRLGDYEGAKEIMRRALVLDGERSPELLRHYGDILRALGDEFMAEVYFRRAETAEE